MRPPVGTGPLKEGLRHARGPPHNARPPGPDHPHKVQSSSLHTSSAFSFTNALRSSATNAGARAGTTTSSSTFATRVRTLVADATSSFFRANAIPQAARANHQAFRSQASQVFRSTGARSAGGGASSCLNNLGTKPAFSSTLSHVSRNTGTSVGLQPARQFSSGSGGGRVFEEVIRNAPMWARVVGDEAKDELNSGKGGKGKKGTNGNSMMKTTWDPKQARKDIRREARMKLRREMGLKGSQGKQQKGMKKYFTEAEVDETTEKAQEVSTPVVVTTLTVPLEPTFSPASLPGSSMARTQRPQDLSASWTTAGGGVDSSSSIDSLLESPNAPLPRLLPASALRTLSDLQSLYGLHARRLENLEFKLRSSGAWDEVDRLEWDFDSELDVDGGGGGGGGRKVLKMEWIRRVEGEKSGNWGVRELEQALGMWRGEERWFGLEEWEEERMLKPLQTRLRSPSSSLNSDEEDYDTDQESLMMTVSGVDTIVSSNFASSEEDELEASIPGFRSVNLDNRHSDPESSPAFYPPRQTHDFVASSFLLPSPELPPSISDMSNSNSSGRSSRRTPSPIPPLLDFAAHSAFTSIGVPPAADFRGRNNWEDDTDVDNQSFHNSSSSSSPSLRSFDSMPSSGLISPVGEFEDEPHWENVSNYSEEDEEEDDDVPTPLSRNSPLGPAMMAR